MNLDYNLACSRFQICFNGQIEVGTKDPIKYYWQFSTKVLKIWCYSLLFSNLELFTMRVSFRMLWNKTKEQTFSHRTNNTSFKCCYLFVNNSLFPFFKANGQDEKKMKRKSHN